jgi:hypothetical protein
MQPVDLEVTVPAGGLRVVTRVRDVDPRDCRGGALVVRAASTAGGR